ncbi:MAG: hypothetical protein PHH85_09050 [Candidatus Methanoperedens sp.]|nr:hypothetical protein [Candidatus Methanoperedens sp.]
MSLAEIPDEDLLQEVKQRGFKIELSSEIYNLWAQAKTNAEDNLNRAIGYFRNDDLDEVYGDSQETKRDILNNYRIKLIDSNLQIKIGGVSFDINK